MKKSNMTAAELANVLAIAPALVERMPAPMRRAYEQLYKIAVELDAMDASDDREPEGVIILQARRRRRH